MLGGHEKCHFPLPSLAPFLSSFLVQGTHLWCSDTTHAASGTKTTVDISRGHQLTAKYCKIFSSFFNVNILILYGFKHCITSHTNGELEIYVPLKVQRSDWKKIINLSLYLQEFWATVSLKNITARQEYNILDWGLLS